MIKPDNPRKLAVDLLPRSICMVQVGSCVTDPDGNIIAWGWNGMGPTGYGLCAERHAISRANKKRLKYGTIYVAGQYRDTGRMVFSRPCDECMRTISKYKLEVWFRDDAGRWR